MMTVAFRPMACAPEMPKMPKRLARLRRNVESKRIENFKKIHESLKQTAKEEQQALRDFWKGLTEERKTEEEDETQLSKTGEDDEE